eukprot:TRINITY_DN5944_c0_g1_i2.p1 TRINITY_DN5944_c0_g1~~TRINITY_DN5944_c0_g1_i2.p1  ORF type:complete len:281 (+),score=82.12 TRINITY_DN5944_c0_g1_i2:99-845(+)
MVAINFFFIFTWWLWPIYLAYLIWMFFFDSKATRSLHRARPWLRANPLWKHFRDYFPAKVIKTADLDDTKTYLFGMHPHGIISYGVQANFGNDYSEFKQLYPNIKYRVATLASNFKIPLARHWFMGLGYTDASRGSLLSLLNRKCSVMLVIGGAEEALLARPGGVSLVLAKRMGFVRLALQSGACLVPVYTFGENDLYNQVDNPPGSRVRRFQEWGKNVFGFSLPLFNGHFQLEVQLEFQQNFNLIST